MPSIREQIATFQNQYGEGLLTGCEAMLHIFGLYSKDVPHQEKHMYEILEGLSEVVVEMRKAEIEKPEVYKAIDGFRFYVVECKGTKLGKKFNEEVQGSYAIYCTPVPHKGSGWFFTTYATRSIAEDVVDRMTKYERERPFDYQTYLANFSSTYNPHTTQEKFRAFCEEQKKKETTS